MGIQARIALSRGGAVSGLADTVGHWWSARMPGLQGFGKLTRENSLLSADWTRITPFLSLLVH